MINPLQAMQASRGANQNRASAIQSQGAVNESQNLQRQQLNTGSIGARMDGRSPQMLAVDPNMYADRKQQRDFTALNQERTRQATAQQNQIQNQQALAREELRYKNNLATGEANANLQRQNVLDAESRAAKIATQQRVDEIEQKKAMFALTDERYKDLRGPAGQVIQQYNAWTTASPTTGKTGAEEFQTKSYHDNIKQQAYALGDTAIIQHWKDVNKDKLGGNTANPLTQPKVGSKAYTDAAMGLLTSSAEFPTIQGKAQKEAEQQAYAFGQSIKTGYVTTLKATSELGYSPDMSGQIGNPLYIPEGPTFDSGLPGPPVDKKPAEEGSPYIIPSIVAGVGDFASGLGDKVMENKSALAGVSASAFLANEMSRNSVDQANAISAKVDNRSLTATRKKGMTVAEVNQQKIDNFKALAKSTRSKIPTDAEIIKMKPAQLKKFVADNTQSILGKYVGKIRGLDGKVMKAVKKLGIVGLVGVTASDLVTALSREEVEALTAGNAIAQQTNEATGITDASTGSVGEVGWSVEE